MKTIELTKGAVAIVDDEDFEEVNCHKWQISRQGYACSDIGGRKNKKKILMHIIVNKTPIGMVTDHINRNKLDNRRCNLRSVTGSQNGFNCKLSKNNSSGYNGIIWYKNRWVSRIKIKYEDIYLGRFINIEDAILVRKKAEEKYGVSQFSNN